MLQRPARAVTRLAHAGTALLLALGVLYGFVAWHVLRDREESSMLSMAVMVSNAVDTYFSATEASLVTLRDTLSDDRSRPRAGAMLQRRLDDFASGRPEIQLVALVDGSGKMLAASRRDGITALPDIAGGNDNWVTHNPYRGNAKAIEIGERLCRSGRVNRNYYPFTISRILESVLPLEDLENRRVFYYIYVQSRETVEADDDDWEQVCLELDESATERLILQTLAPEPRGSLP